MSLPRRLAAACVAVVCLTSLTQPAWADRHDKLRHERAHAARLHAQAAHQRAAIATGRQRLARLDAQANAALAALQGARLAADKAKTASDAAQQQLANAQVRTEVARDALNAMAADAYVMQTGSGTLASTMALLDNGNPQDFVDGLQLMSAVGDGQQSIIDDLRVAQNQQLRSQLEAQAAADRAVAAERGAVIAKQHVDTLVHEQQREVEHQRQLLASTQHAVAESRARQQALERAIARAAAIRAAQARAFASTGQLAKCDGGSVAGYPNGQLPMRSLCPLWGAPGEMLRQDAAAAFNRMSQAYSAAFGTPLCVTSSYRTYQHQAELYATMPAGYAAAPGTSNHGWAVAVDLCGGIQVDGSAQSNWLLDHAPSYNWFHPAWARAGGGGPHEPWHWEYAG